MIFGLLQSIMCQTACRDSVLVVGVSRCSSIPGRHDVWHVSLFSYDKLHARLVDRLMPRIGSIHAARYAAGAMARPGHVIRYIYFCAPDAIHFGAGVDDGVCMDV